MAPTAATLTTSPSWRSFPASLTSLARTWVMASFAALTRQTPLYRAHAATPTPTRPLPPPGSLREWWRTDQEPPCSRLHWPWASSSWWQCLWGNKWRILSDRAATGPWFLMVSSPDWFQESDGERFEKIFSGHPSSEVSHWAEKAVITSRLNS